MVLDGISATNQKECAMLAFLYEKNVVHVPAGSKQNGFRKRWDSAILHPDTSCNATFFDKASMKLRRIIATTQRCSTPPRPLACLSKFPPRSFRTAPSAFSARMLIQGPWRTSIVCCGSNPRTRNAATAAHGPCCFTQAAFTKIPMTAAPARPARTAPSKRSCGPRSCARSPRAGASSTSPP